MRIKILEDLKKHKSVLELCEAYGLELFEDVFYKMLSPLGEGGFGTVWKCMDIRDRELVAVKFVDMKTVIRNQEKMISNLSSFFVEKKMLEKISRENSPFLPKYFGAFFKLDPQQRENIDQLILVTEAGDHNLKELVAVRKEMSCNEKRMSAYLPEEIFTFLKQMSEAFLVLKKLRVYHSDIKLNNIVYFKSSKGYKVIDFGVSKGIPKKKNRAKENNADEDEVSGEEYATAGTRGYNSPEKTKFLQNNNDSKNFNPFKCDMWSLGICIEKMSGKNQEHSSKQYLKEIVEKLMAKDWKQRYNADELAKAISDLERKGLFDRKEPHKTEGLYVAELDVRKMEENGHEILFERLDDAQQVQEMLEVARNQFRKVEAENGPLNQENEQKYDGALSMLGRK